MRSIWIGLIFCAALWVSAGADQARRLTGKLEIPAGAGTKDSYRTGNFQLVTAEGTVILTESTDVPAAKLRSFRGKRVTVTAQYLQAQVANPNEQAPQQLSPEGKVVLEKHPESYRVWTIEAAR